MYIAKCSGGTWGDIYGPFALPWINAGNNTRRDASNAWDPLSGSNLLTESGKYQPAGYVIHGVDYAWITFDTTDPTNPASFSTNWGARFGISNGGFNNSAGWQVSYGYSTVLGYYQFAGYWTYTAASIVSSRDITGASSTVYTEAQWYAGSRYLMNVSAESATGLRVSTKPYPLFIGGYYTTTPDITLPLTANDVNYLYVKKTDPNRDSTEVFVSTDLLPIGFSQQLIAILRTDNDKVIGSRYIPITSNTYAAVNGIAYATSEIKLTTSTALTFDGTNLTCTGNIIAFSDAKLKKNIKVIDCALHKVNQLHGYTFDRIDIEGARQTGVLAQEVLQVLPEAVSENADGIYSVAYGNMVGLLIESVKELTQQVADLQAQLQAIKK
jgi:hypothetical protein